jgi:hypothetical protein
MESSKQRDVGAAQMAAATSLQRFDEATAIAKAALEANQHRLRTRSCAGGTPEAIAAFYAKGLKSMRALRVLAVAGSGEDAFILLRSLTNTAIDMAFISQSDTDERLSQWVAAARIARRDLAESLGETLLDETKTDWAAVKAQADQWKGRGIRQRAEAAQVEHLYQLMYRFGSGFEHPDAWMMSDLISVRDSEIVMQTEPATRYVDNVLIGALFCLGVMLGRLAQYFEFERNDDVVKLQRLIQSLA